MTAVINAFHRSLSRITKDTSAQDLKRTQLRLHSEPLILYKPLILRLPSRAHVRVLSGVLSFFIRNKWLINFYHLFFARVLRSSVYFTIPISRFFGCSPSSSNLFCRFSEGIFVRKCLASHAFIRIFVMGRVSEQYSHTQTTFDLKILSCMYFSLYPCLKAL